MTEGDLAAGDLDIPVEWLENLNKEGRVFYLEQGLWIAAEQEADYHGALEEGNREKACSIIRRMLRYRGGASARQVALRYNWQEEKALELLKILCENGEVVSQEESFDEEKRDKVVVYYHAQLYKRARNKTLKNRREEIFTCPPQAYVALLASRMRRSVPSEESLKMTVSSFAGTTFPAALWEEVLFPSRVKNYREGQLDALLSAGEYFWHMEEGGKVRFERTDEIEWEKEPEINWENLSEKEKMLAQALSRRGASFMQALNGVLEGESPYDTLLALMEKGIVCADSFVPVRQWLDQEKIKKSAARVRVGARVKALQAGRWDLVRPLRPLSVQEQMERCFDRYLILCRESAAAYGLSWPEALSLIRIQEYTGQVRRGYFVEGLSGAQFIRGKDFGGVTAALSKTESDMVWLNGADPMQIWGKLLPHKEGKSFLNISGSVVALKGGKPVAVFEKQGKTLRVFEEKYLGEAIKLFVKEYKKGQIFKNKKRIQVKEYPFDAAKSLAENGFGREVLGYSLYR